MPPRYCGTHIQKAHTENDAHDKHQLPYAHAFAPADEKSVRRIQLGNTHQRHQNIGRVIEIQAFFDGEK